MILVTGGTGLVGSHLLLNLVQSGHRVRATYRKKDTINRAKHVFSYYTDKVDSLFSHIEWVQADITEIPSLLNAFIDITHVYHCAAYISFDPKYYHTLRKTNIEGTANIVNLCLSHNIKKLCHVSSIAAIGAIDTKKINTEESSWNKEEDHSVYAITKYGSELEVWRGCQEGLNIVIVNPGIIIGPGYWRLGSGHFFKRIARGMTHYTTGVTGFVAIEDVIQIMVSLMQSTLVNERYIVVAENLSFKDFFNKIANALKVDPPIKRASAFLLEIAWRMDWLRCKLKGKHRKLVKQSVKTLQRVSKFDNSKIKTALNYSFKPIDTSIASTSHYFLNDEDASSKAT